MSGSPEKYVLVYDVGGSHVSAAVCASGSYALSGQTREHLPADVSAEAFAQLIYTLGETAAKSAAISLSGIDGACLAMPGPFDYEKGISHMDHKLPSLKGVDLKVELARKFGWQPAQVRFLNDAAAFLLGEVGAGAAKGYAKAIGLTLGTGIGSAFAAAGHILMSGSNIPPGGEIWNVPYLSGIIEDFVSTRYLKQRYEALTGVDAEVSVIAGMAREDGNEGTLARQVFCDFGRNIGSAVLHVLGPDPAAGFVPDVIVLGGGIARSSELFLPAMRETLGSLPITLAISALMDEAPLAGAGVHYFTV